MGAAAPVGTAAGAVAEEDDVGVAAARARFASYIARLPGAVAEEDDVGAAAVRARFASYIARLRTPNRPRYADEVFRFP